MWEGMSRAGNHFKSAWRSQLGRTFRQGVGEGLGMYYAKDAGGVLRNTGFLGRKAARMGINPLGTFGKMFAAFGLISVGMSAYEGYKEGGTWGAIKGASGELAIWGAASVAFRMFGPIAGVAAIGYGGYQLGEASKMHVRRLRKLEMGRDVPDMFGTISTIRQRSLRAIQNTHIGGRTALGNEAFILSRGR